MLKMRNRAALPFPELFRGHACVFAELIGKVVDIIETYLLGDRIQGKVAETFGV